MSEGGIRVEKHIVKTEYLDLELPPEGFRLSNGEFLQRVTVAYERYGELAPDRSNVIFVLHALTGDAHAAFYSSPEDNTPGWWDDLIGPHKAVDTNRYHVICCNILGGCKGTTGPASINPATGQPYGTSFPLITLDDTVEVEKLFLTQLGIEELYAVIGGSLGGMRALNWAIRYPRVVKRCICVASAVNLTPQALAFDIIGRQEIECDPDFHDGAYYTNSVTPCKGLSRARQIGHVTYLSAASMRLKFGREQHDRPLPADSSKFSTSFEVESYLGYQGDKFVHRFDANSYLYITRMMDMFDLAKAYGSVKRAFADVGARFLVVSITSDWLFPPEQQLEILAGLLANRKDVSFFQIDSPYGHDAFLIEYDILARGVDAFLNGQRPAASEMPASANRLDTDRICDIVDRGAHILDIGSGEGSLFIALQEQKQVTGLCLDRSFDMVVSCMRNGLSALQLDADKGLGSIVDNAFDWVLLNQTIQQLNSALQATKHMLRIGHKAIIGFPNFAYYAYRVALAIKGKLPVSDTLPYQWYDTPNIHLVTLRDFRELCERHDIGIGQIQYLADTALGKFLVGLGMTNLGAERVLATITRPSHHGYQPKSIPSGQ